MDKKTKNHGKSIRAKLLNVAKEEGVFYQTVLTRYFQERLLYRLSQTRYRVNFYFERWRIDVRLRQICRTSHF